MFDEPEERDDGPNDAPAERAADPAARALEKSNELRLHAELAAVFEGRRKFDVRLRPGLDADVARGVQRAMAKLDKTRVDNNPVLQGDAAAEAFAVLSLPGEKGLTTGDYHIQRRPGEAMIVRWLAGDEVDTFYARLQAHFDAGLNGYREEERQTHGWKQDAATLAYLAALDAMDVKLEQRYLRDALRTHPIAVLSTQTADEMNVLFLCEHVMSVTPAELLGPKSAPPDAPRERDLAWFFKLFLLRGSVDGEERMCFFTFLQKSDEEFDEADGE